jgi:putative transcriptional regulator
MITRSILTDGIVNSLLENEFEVLLTRGCFDIAAKREQLVLIKALTNIDGFDQEQAQSLRTISYYVSAHPFVVSVRTNRSILVDNTVYERFDLPVVTPRTFGTMLDEDAYVLNSAKGRHTVEVDTGKLRAKRYEMEFTLEELANLVGISKKAMYEIESKRTNPTEDTARKIEIALKVKLKTLYNPLAKERSSDEDTRMKNLPSMHDQKYSDPLQKAVNKELDRIGIRNSPVSHAPFEIVGRDRKTIITGISELPERIEKVASPVSKISKIFGGMAFMVTRQKKEKRVDGLPVFVEKDLEEIGSAKELEEKIEEAE